MVTSSPSARPGAFGPAVLHALRCIGSTDLARLAAATGLPEPDVETELIDLAVTGLVIREPGPFGGWALTAAGKEADAARTADELAAAGARAVVAAIYDRFLPLNRELLDLCTAWQMRATDGVPRVNDHRDPGYDARVLRLLGELDGRAAALCAELAAVLARFGRYRVRLADALARAAAGGHDYVVNSMDAYHTVWFQLHEDLLVTLGIPR